MQDNTQPPVEQGVPIPVGRGLTGILRSLQVEQSFMFPLAQRSTMQTLVTKIKKDTAREFTVRKVDDEYARVWRTK